MMGNSAQGGIPTQTEAHFRGLLTYYLESDGAYFQHKETMAHAALGAEIALFGVLLTVAQWPPGWVKDVDLSPSRVIPAAVVMDVALVGIWTIVHVFMRRQLRFARWAAIHQAAALRTLRDWASTSPTADELTTSGANDRGASLVVRLLDHLLPLWSRPVTGDIDSQGEPTGFVCHLREQLRTGTFFRTSEILLTIASLFVLALFLFCRVWAR